MPSNPPSGEPSDPAGANRASPPIGDSGPGEPPRGGDNDVCGLPRCAFDVVLALTGLAAAATLVLEYGGFALGDLARQLLHLAEPLVVGLFVLDRLARLVLAPDRGQHLRENWIDFALIVLAAACLVAVPRFRVATLAAGALYIVLTQVYAVVAWVLRGVSYNLRHGRGGISPGLALGAGVFLLVVLGGGLLMLPAAVYPEYYIRWYQDNALFSSASAVCLSGLVIFRDVGIAGNFTPFGQAVILVLMQAGGLCAMLFGAATVTLARQALSSAAAPAEPQAPPLPTAGHGELGRMAAFVVTCTFLVEAVGAVLLYPMFAAPQGVSPVAPSVVKAAWDSIFHSVSAFCNAGLSLYKDSLMAGVRGDWVTPLRAHWQVYGVLGPLIILGGLGFPVLEDLARCLGNALRRALGRQNPDECLPTARGICLHTRLVLGLSVFLIVAGAFLILLVEPVPGHHKKVVEKGTIQNEALGPIRSDWDRMTPPERILHATFLSASARTGGLSTMDPADLSVAGKLVLCWLMLIGAGPAGAAGGLRTVTLVVLVLAAWYSLRRRSDDQVYRRSITPELLRKSLTLAVLYLAMVGIVTLLLAVALREKNFNAIDVLVEACSACSMSGLTCGVTPLLNLFGKVLIMLAMLIGRVGPLVLLMAMTRRLRPSAGTTPDETLYLA